MSERRTACWRARRQTGSGEQGSGGQTEGVEEFLERLGWTRPPQPLAAAHMCTPPIQELMKPVFLSRGERAAGNFTVNK